MMMMMMMMMMTSRGAAASSEYLDGRTDRQTDTVNEHRALPASTRDNKTSDAPKEEKLMELVAHSESGRHVYVTTHHLQGRPHTGRTAG